MTLTQRQKASILHPGFHPNAPALKGFAAMSIECRRRSV